MDLTYSATDEAFRAEVRAFLEDHLAGDFRGLKGLGGPGRDHEALPERDRKSTRLNSSHVSESRMPSSA